MTEGNTINWISTVVVPRILQKKEFRGYIIQKTEVQATESNKDNWASSLFQINLHVIHDGDRKSLPLILKLMDEREKVRVRMSSEKQFFNEIHFYSAIIPLFLSHVTAPFKERTDLLNMFPKCIYTYYDKTKMPLTTKDAIVVMEDLKISNFKLGNRTTLDFNHCHLALTHLGRFHAFSYFVKERDPDAFRRSIMLPLHETRFVPAATKAVNNTLDVCERRVIDELAKELPEDDPGLARLREIADRPALDVFIDLLQPLEPLSVLCHGDFLRNNLMFRYENHELTDSKIIDFQMIRYSSPSIDVSMLICMNTSHALRVAHFDDLLQVYHTSLTETLANLLGKPKEDLDQRYSFGVFLADFRQYALYGYLMAIEFIPWMEAHAEELDEMNELLVQEKGSPEYVEAARVLGGDEATRVCVELAKDLLAKQCL